MNKKKFYSKDFHNSNKKKGWNFWSWNDIFLIFRATLFMFIVPELWLLCHRQYRINCYFAVWIFFVLCFLFYAGSDMLMTVLVLNSGFLENLINLLNELMNLLKPLINHMFNLPHTQWRSPLFIFICSNFNWTTEKKVEYYQNKSIWDKYMLHILGVT